MCAMCNKNLDSIFSPNRASGLYIFGYNIILLYVLSCYNTLRILQILMRAFCSDMTLPAPLPRRVKYSPLPRPKIHCQLMYGIFYANFSHNGNKLGNCPSVNTRTYLSLTRAFSRKFFFLG